MLKYAGLNEKTSVPYHPGQPRPGDVLHGIGKNLQELLPGKDCLPGTTCAMSDVNGKTEGKRMAAMHEEPTGLWNMGDSGRAYGKMLVLWCASKLGDYVYFIRWRFRDDGMMMPQVGLTGKLNHTQPANVANRARWFTTGREPRCSGPRTSTTSTTGWTSISTGRKGTWWRKSSTTSRTFRTSASIPRIRGTPLRRECARSLDPLAFRSWRAVNYGSKNRHGFARSYELVPGGNGIFRGAASEMISQADFWVQRYRPNEFPLSATDDRSVKEALPRYINDEPLDGQDVVVWYVMHVHHLPRTENWPEMPVEWAGFDLVPRDFLDVTPIDAKKEP